MLKDAIREVGDNSALLEGLPRYTPDVRVFDASEELDTFAANMVALQLIAKKNSVLTLLTGNTPIGMYEKLVRYFEAGMIDFSEVVILNLDEYHPIDPNSPDSYASFMRRHLFSCVNVQAENCHIPNGAAPNPYQEAARFQRIMDQNQPVDLAVLGIGPGTTCHVGFNEHGSPVNSGVRYVTLDPQTKETNAKLFADPTQIPEGALSQGIADILQSVRILMIAKGSGKAWGINRTLKGPIDPEAPASFLRLHPNVTFAMDKAAAKYLG